MNILCKMYDGMHDQFGYHIAVVGFITTLIEMEKRSTNIGLMFNVIKANFHKRILE